MLCLNLGTEKVQKTSWFDLNDLFWLLQKQSEMIWLPAQKRKTTKTAVNVPGSRLKTPCFGATKLTRDGPTCHERELASVATKTSMSCQSNLKSINSVSWQKCLGSMSSYLWFYVGLKGLNILCVDIHLQTTRDFTLWRKLHPASTRIKGIGWHPVKIPGTFTRGRHLVLAQACSSVLNQY